MVAWAVLSASHKPLWRPTVGPTALGAGKHLLDSGQCGRKRQMSKINNDMVSRDSKKCVGFGGAKPSFH